jgi:hypothetical protein
MDLDYRTIFKEFNRRGIDYLVVGGLAVNFHGVPRITYESLKQRAVAFELGEERIPTVSIHDLIEMKLKAGRKQDLSDVEHLKIILEK